MAVVLAAGGSSRLGSPKQLLRLGGEPLVRHAARAAHQAGASSVIVVLGAEAARVRHALGELPGVHAVTNPDWQVGLASSLVVGIDEAAALGADAALVTLADQPRVDARALAPLVAAYRNGARLVAAAHGDVVSVPALFGHEHFAALRALSGDAGAGRWLRAQGDAVLRVPLDAAMDDVDTLEDAVRLGLEL